MKATFGQLLQALAEAACYTVFNSDAPDEDKAVLTSFVDYVSPGLMEATQAEILKGVE